jgi:hypothetical protein
MSPVAVKYQAPPGAIACDVCGAHFGTLVRIGQKPNHTYRHRGCKPKKENA